MAARSGPPHLPRYLIGLPIFCTYTPKGAQTTGVGSGWTRDLSEAGACLELLEALAPGTPLSLVLQAEPDNLALEATVIWVGHPSLPGGHTLHGVTFPQLTSDQRQALQALLRRTGSLKSRAHRLPAAFPVQCHSAGASEPALRGWTGNLSPGGCALLLPDRLPVGTLLDLTLTTPRGDFTGPATVVWVERAAPETARHLAGLPVRPPPIIGYPNPSPLNTRRATIATNGSMVRIALTVYARMQIASENARGCFTFSRDSRTRCGEFR